MKKIIFTDHMKQGVDYDFFERMTDLEVLTAYSNADALRIHRKEKADIIVTEIFGSGMNGRQFCSHIREDAELRGVSIIVCCRDNEIERAEAAQCRANAVLTLPLSSSALREKVRELLSIPSRGSFRARFCAHAGGAPRALVDCRTENISVTGMLIESDVELHRGDLLTYSLDLAAERSFPLEAEVVRTDRNRYGVRFSRIDPAARLAIEDLVSRVPAAR